MSKAIGKRIQEIIIKILEKKPEGMQLRELLKTVIEADKNFNQNTVIANIIKIGKGRKVYKPSKGFYRLTKFRSIEERDESVEITPQNKKATRASEEEFYQPFAEWLKVINEVTAAIPLGGKSFKNKWGTPDVIGINSPQIDDIIKRERELVSAEIKVETSQLITAFGQACAYKLFSHKTYLVIPNASDEDDKARIESLCLLLGIGLILFNANEPENPDFTISVRPKKHEPDLIYTNEYIKRKEIKNKLFK